MVKIYTKIITEKILILLRFETQKNNKAEGEKTKLKNNPQKSASERAAAILVYEICCLAVTAQCFSI